MQISTALLIFTTLICAAHGARILGVFHVASYSHYQLGDKLFKGLAARGHEVTIITPYVEKTPVKNFKQIVLTGAVEEFEAVKGSLFDQSNTSLIHKVVWTESLGHTLTERTLNHTCVKQLLKSNELYDLVIINQFGNEAFKGFCHHFRTPCVVLIPMPIPHWTHDQVANPDSPAYVPVMYSYLNTANQTTFYERFYNSLVYVAVKLFTHLYALPKQNELLQKYFSDAPHLNDLYYNTSLILVNSHISFNPSLPYVPNMLEIGGLHVSPPKALEKSLKDYLDNAKDGAIFFSLGSNLRSKDLPKEKVEEILRVFAKLKQKVLWKWEDEKLPDQPPNVKVGKWFPQQDILAHPNIQLFITHGGLMSMIEAIYHGVPVIVIPVFADQERNAALANAFGFGIAVPYKQFTGEAFDQAINEILNNAKYLENAKKRSEIMHDEPLKPLDKAIFWVEYVIRYQGAPHLRSAALNLTWYQYLLLDVVLVVILITVILLFVVSKVIKKVFCKKAFENVNQKKKNN